MPAGSAQAMGPLVSAGVRLPNASTPEAPPPLLVTKATQPPSTACNAQCAAGLGYGIQQPGGIADALFEGIGALEPLRFAGDQHAVEPLGWL